MPIQSDYLERVYAGFLGKNVGIRLGAPVEPAIWTYERIREVYGEVSGYLKPFRNFAADDDANGPVFFIRPLIEDKGLRDIDSRAVGRAWLDYAREGRGMFWWGGYGVSTEHTAYLNLKSGVAAPESGSIARNGAAVAEQIGGQIFIDTWGLVWPGNPRKAADFAEAAARVSHDGEGAYGARFIAACIAAAFSRPKGGMGAVIEAGLAELPLESRYLKVARAVLAFHAAHPGDWRACMEYLLAEWGYDRYPGLCHMIPNAGVCVLALAYGAGSFSRTVEIATMCGWDTDCNAGNVGAIAGVLYGLADIPPKYRDPINDALVLSGLPGSLNILDLPTFSRVLASIGYRLAGEAAPPDLSAALEAGDGERAFHFDFALPGSTHGLRISDPVNFGLAHRPAILPGGRSALEFRFERLAREASGRLFWKPFYRRADFDDERYSPVFSPVARPGQVVRIRFATESWEGEKIGVVGYVRDTATGALVEAGSLVFPRPGETHTLEFAIPDLQGSEADEVGLLVTGYSGAARRDSGRLLVDLFEVGGKARYAIDLSRQALEFASVTPFSHDHGSWALEGGRLRLMTPEAAFSYTGGHAVTDESLTARVSPLAGESHLLGVRLGGATRGYYGGFSGRGEVALFRRDLEVTELGRAAFPWKAGVDYEVSLEARGESLVLSVDGKAVLAVTDGVLKSGMVGCGSLGPARALYGPFQVVEL